MSGNLRATPEDILAAAMAAFREGRFADAANGFRDLTISHPDIGELHMNLGASLRAVGDVQAARTACQRATELMPDNGMAWFNLANTLRDLQETEAALAANLRAESLMPGTPEILNNQGVLHTEAGRPDAAVAVFDRLLAAKADFADAHTNRGNALQRLGRLGEARKDFEAALALQPENPVFCLNMSAFLAAAGERDEALVWAEHSLDLDPTYIDAELKCASLLIQQGDFRAGFAAYEARWRKPAWHAMPKRLGVPVWDGGNLAGKHLLVWNEQGFGDALLYARYLPVLAAWASRVTFLCEQPLLKLMRASFADICDVRELTDVPAGADRHVSIMSLPYLLGTETDTIPAGVPYLKADAGAVARWQRTLEDGLGRGPKVGLVWAGNPKQAHDYARSMPTECIAPLLETPGIGFVNLQLGPRGDDLRHPAFLDIRAGIGDFADSAALFSALDMIVSVDSAPAHLAGALGRPALILLAFDPDSRYLLGREDCPWYPTARLVRQQRPGDWTDLIARTRALIAKRL